MDGKPVAVLYCCGMGHLAVSLLLFLFTAEPLVSGACLEEGFGDSGCDSFRNLLSDCGHIQTAGFPLAPYKNDTVCEWHVHVRPRHRIVLVFDRFELEESGVTCEYDQLSIHDGVNEKAPKLGTFCGRYDSFKVLSSRNHLYLKFTSDASMAAAGFYASYISEDVGHEAHQAIVDMGQKTFPCPDVLNITGDEMVASTPEQFLLQRELRERLWILWDPWGAADGSYLRIYEGDNINTTPALVDNFRHEGSRSFSPKGHQLILSLLLRNREGGVFVQCFIEDIADELPLCFPDWKNTDIGSVVFDKNVLQEPDDIGLPCKVPVKTAIDQQLLVSMDLVNSPTVSAGKEISDYNARVALYDRKKRLGFLTSTLLGSKMALPLPSLTSGNELLIILWTDSANLQRAQWIPEVKYSPTACQDLSHQLRKNGTTTTQVPCGIFKHLPEHDYTNYDYRMRIEGTENMYIELLLPPLSRYDGIRFMCKGMKNGCDEDLQIYDLQGNSPVLIYSYCREAEEEWKIIRSSSHAVEVVYRSFCTWSRSGFYFSFRTTECTWVPTSSCNQQQDLQAPCGFFQPPSRSDLDRQPLVCDWQISPPPGNKIVITFQNLSLTADQKGEDFILIQELGDDGTFRTVLDIRQSYPLFSVESRSSEVLVKFVKDRIGTKKDAAFTAFYTTTKAVTPKTGPFEMEELCESGFQYYRSNCYRVVINEETLSWETAQQRCTEAGSDLASISSPDEMEHVKELLRETASSDGDSSITAFIGLMTTGHDAKYAWVDGSKVLFTYWRGKTPLPAGQNTESCALMLTGRTETKWFTVPCNYPDATRTYICKAKARGCNKDWTMVGLACLRPYGLSPHTSNPIRQARRLCAEADSSVATVNSSIDFLRVQGYLQNMWPVYPRPRVFMNIKYDGFDTCGVVERRYNTEGDRWIVPRTDCAFRRPNLVLCSMRVDASTCPSSCKCSDGVVSCINKGLAKIPAKIPRTTRELYLARNRLNLTKDSLRTWRLLTTLDVSENSLREIPVGIFSSMFRLQTLNISGNFIHRLTAEAFRGLANLHVLDLTGNNVQDISTDAFQGLPNLYKLNTNQYKLCCMAAQTNVCSAQQDYVSSCEHLIGSNSLTVTTWFLGVVSIVGNPIVLIYQVRSKTSGPSKHFLCNLAIADALTGLYMIIIASANTYFQDRYILNEERWRSHAACAIATGLVTFSKMASLFLVVAIVVQIHLISRLPSTIRRFRNRYNAIMITTCWSSAFMCTIVTMNIPYLGLLDVQTTAACSPFIDIIQKQGRWKYWFVLFVTLPTIMTLASVACWSLSCYVEGLNNTTDGDNKVKHHEKQRTTKTIIVTDFVCWIIVAVVGMFSTVQDDIFVTLTPWIALFVVPVTCGLNPMIQAAAATQRWPMKREIACKDDVEVETVEELGRSLHQAEDLTGIEKDEYSEGNLIQSYLRCLSSEIIPNHVVKVLLQFRKGEVQQDATITNEMMILRRIGQAGGHQNIVRQCAIADKDAMKWALYTLHHHYKLREVLTDLTSEDLLTTNLDMTKALNFLHQNDIVLGKMSLDALLVEKEPHLKVLIADFCNAKVVGSNNNSNKDFDADFQEWKKLKCVIERKSSNVTLPRKAVLMKF